MEPTNENTTETKAVATSDLLAGIVDTCRKAEVGRVYAANHHGMKFLLADDGPNASGICYRDDSKSYSELAALAAQVNAALSANKPSGEPPTGRL